MRPNTQSEAERPEAPVAYLGPEGTFTHLAAREQFGEAAPLRGFRSIDEVFAAVERGDVAAGVVPVENTTEGIVTQTFDALARFEVVVRGEALRRISLALLSQTGALADVERVASHPQPLAQCRRWLDAQLPDAPRSEAASTAAAAGEAAQQRRVAAIASPLAAEVYGLRPIARGIEDRGDNTTRFLTLGRSEVPRSGDDLTSVVFTLRKDEAGALYRLLGPFARERVNLTSIQLRPIVGQPWEYLFFLDVEGHREQPAVARALAGAAEVAFSHRVLGSYPRAARREPC